MKYGGQPDGSVMRAKAYLHIQNKIASGELQAGQAISELALAKELGISRTPIREALHQLATEGILEQNPNHRATVLKLTRKDIIELFELREALEMYAVSKVARQPLRPTDLERLQTLADTILPLKDELERSGKSELDEEQMRRFVVDDFRFHTLLLRLAGNDRIVKVANETRLMIRIFAIRRLRHGPSHLEQIHHQHCDIVSTVASRDRERAMHLIAEHIERSLQERLDDYDHWEIENSLRQSLPYFFDVRRIPESE